MHVTYLDQMVNEGSDQFFYTNQWGKCPVIQNPQTETVDARQKRALTVISLDSCVFAKKR